MSNLKDSHGASQKKVKPAVDAIERLVRRLQTTARDPQAHERPDLWSSSIGALTFTSDEAQTFADCLAKLESYCSPTGEFSRSSLFEHVRDAVLRSLDPESRDAEKAFDVRLRREVKRLREFLESDPVPWDIYLPVRGIDDESLPRRFGKITLTPTTDTAFPERLAPIDPTSEGVHRAAATYAQKNIREAFDGHIAAHIMVGAVDQDAARTLGTEEIRRTIDIINFYADIYRPQVYRAMAYLSVDERERSEHWVVHMREAGPVGGAGLTVVEGLDFVWLPASDSEDAKEYGLDRVDLMLSKEKRTEVDERILSAAHWAGRATVERRKETAFLLFAITLEALLADPSNHGDVTYRLKMRAAHLCAKADVASRKLYSAHVGRLYDLRSKIVHSGHVDITEQQLSAMRDVAKSAIILMLTQEKFHKIETHKELDGWFEERALE